MAESTDPLQLPEMDTAHVLFMDIVGWSKLLDDKQTEVQQALQQIVLNANEYQRGEQEGMVTLPTGDGMALVFFRRPEAPVRLAIEVARGVKHSNLPNLHLRMGVHSGPVFQRRDITGRMNVVGDGVNIAQRVMDCGDAGHLLVSDKAAGDLRRVSAWAEILHDLGKVEVKHGVTVHLFNLVMADVGKAETPTKFLQQPSQPQTPAPSPQPAFTPVTAAPLTLATAAGKQVAFVYKRGNQPDELLLTLLEMQLKGKGYEIFTDDRKLTFGIEWAKQVDAKARTSDFVIPLLSEQSIHSEMLVHELQSAHEVAGQQGGKPKLVPIRINYPGPLPDTMAALLSSLEQLVWTAEGDEQRLAEEVLDTLSGRKEAARSKPKRSSISMEELESVGGAVPLQSKFYVERAADPQFLAAITRRDSIVLLKGARQMGKTSLLARGLQTARAYGARVLLTDFQEFNASQMETLEKQYHVLSESLADQLDLDVLLSDTYKPGRSPNANFERYLRTEVLEKMDCPLVWGLDEVDRLFMVPHGGEIFALFRTWHNKRALDPTGPWSRFTLAIAYATEAHLFITDINQSPFNVGTRLMLEDFNLEQLKQLNALHGAPMNAAELARYHSLVGGHPFLVRRGLQLMASGMSFDEFVATADNDQGPLGDHLRRILLTVAQDDDLCNAVRGLLHGQACPNAESFYRLRSSGVMAGDVMQDIHPRCQVYATYLKRHLVP